MTDRQSTHGHDCGGWGPKHYECAVREIEALRAEVAEWKRVADALEAARKDGWQPIETAPKDGSEIILFDPDYSQRSGFEGRYSAPRGNWLSSYDSPVKPTHWMPLPPPPAIDQARGEGVE